MVLPLLQRSTLRGVQQLTKPWASAGCSLRMVRRFIVAFVRLCNFCIFVLACIVAFGLFKDVKNPSSFHWIQMYLNAPKRTDTNISLHLHSLHSNWFSTEAIAGIS